MFDLILDLLSIVFRVSVILYVLKVFDIIKLNKPVDQTTSNSTEVVTDPKNDLMGMMNNMFKQINTNMQNINVKEQ